MVVVEILLPGMDLFGSLGEKLLVVEYYILMMELIGS
jgi:hypothetical protein